MTIQWFGQSFFKISIKNSKGQDVVVAIDPFNSDCGLKTPSKFGADILLITHDHADHNNTKIIKGTNESPEPFIISGPGEYEIKEVMVYGISSYHDDQEGKERGENIIYLINAENMWLAHLGDLGQKTLTDSQLEKIEGTDILCLPVGGNFTINAKEAGKIVSQIEPRVIIPMHYKIKGLNLKIDGVENFIKEIGLPPTEIDKYKIQKKNLPQENQELVILKN